MSHWLQKPIKGLLLDITGVLYESGTDKSIDGSVEAINRLRNARIPFRFVTNETQRTREALVTKLKRLGFRLTEDDVFAPGPAVCNLLKNRQLRPFLLVHPGILPEFADCDQLSPNCVVIGDAGDNFTYENVNKAFRILMSCEPPILISMGKTKYYKDKDELMIDLGAYTSALEFSCDIKAEVMGKPASQFFLTALKDIGISPEEAVMIGDDINSDVGAAQNCGFRGVLVRTGKFRPSDEQHDKVKPDAIVDNLAQAVEQIMQNIKC